MTIEDYFFHQKTVLVNQLRRKFVRFKLIHITNIGESFCVDVALKQCAVNQDFHRNLKWDVFLV